MWAFNRDGIIQFTCECAGRIGNGPADRWSLVDFFINLDGSVRLAHEMWRMLGHFGGGQFLVELSVPKLVPHTAPAHYRALLYGVNFGLSLDVARKLGGDYEIASGRGEAALGYDARSSQRTRSLANLGNEVLRDLRFGADVMGREMCSSTCRSPEQSTLYWLATARLGLEDGANWLIP